MKETLMKINISGSEKFLRQLSKSDSLRKEIKDNIELIIKSSNYFECVRLLYPGFVAVHDKGYFIYLIGHLEPDIAIDMAVEFLTDWWIYFREKCEDPECRIFISFTDISSFSSDDRIGFSFSGFEEISLLEKIADDGDIIVSDDYYKSEDQLYISDESRIRTFMAEKRGKVIHKIIIDNPILEDIPYVYDLDDLEDWYVDSSKQSQFANFSALLSSINYDYGSKYAVGLKYIFGYISNTLINKLISLGLDESLIRLIENDIRWDILSLSDMEIEKRKILKTANSLLMHDHEEKKKWNIAGVADFNEQIDEHAVKMLSDSGQNLYQIKKNIEECTSRIVIESFKDNHILEESILDRLIKDVFPPLILNNKQLLENFARITGYKVFEKVFKLMKWCSWKNVYVTKRDDEAGGIRREYREYHEDCCYYGPTAENFENISDCERFVRETLLPIRDAKADKTYACEMGLPIYVRSNDVYFSFNKYISQY